MRWTLLLVSSRICTGGKGRTEVIGLHFRDVGAPAEPLTIQLIQIIALKDRTGNNSCPRRCFQEKRYSPEEYVPFRLDGGVVARLGDCEFRTRRGVGHVACGDVPGVIVGSGGGEVVRIGAGGETCVGWACWGGLVCYCSDSKEVPTLLSGIA